MKKYVLLLCLMTALIVGCSKINQDNYKKLETGMPYDQVTDLLGKPDECTAVIGIKNCIWGDENKNITIKFVSDQVMLFSSKGM